MTIEWQIAKDNPLDNQTDANELLLILTDPFSKNTTLYEGLIRESYPSLTETFRELTVHRGFGDKNGGRPWVLLSFSNAARSLLEKRWMIEKIKSKFLTPETKKISVWLPKDSDESALAIAEDFYFSNWDSLYEKSPFESFKVFISNDKVSNEERSIHNLRRNGQLEFRRWVNANPDEMTSLTIGQSLKEFAATHNCGFMSLNEEDLKSQGMNLLLAVGQASQRSPSRLHILTHNYDPDKPTTLLLGKGVTFDTGGINVKPHESYVNCMKNDMAGAALMSHLFMTLVKAKSPQSLILAIPCCENLVAEKSMKPGSIIRSHSKKKVIIEHTDAEGRLILADALSYCHDIFKPQKTYIAATLTTAALWQYSNFFTGVYFGDQQFERKLSEKADCWGEGFRFWHEFLPFAEGNSHPAGDLTNMGHLPGMASKGGKSCVAAHFLKSFAKYPTVHFDIFASAWNWSEDYPGCGYGSTGAVFNSFFHTLLDA